MFVYYRSVRDRNPHYEAYKGKIHPRDSLYEDKNDKYTKNIDYNTALRGKQSTHFYCHS